MNETEQRRRIIVDDMLQYLRTVADGVQLGHASFLDPADVRSRTTIEHYLERLGEATKALGEPFQTANPGVRWNAWARFRFDRAHPYDTHAKPASYEEIGRFAVDDLPKIARRLRAAKFPKYVDPEAEVPPA
jgi:uncharacterized protein with HEPN domain